MRILFTFFILHFFISAAISQEFIESYNSLLKIRYGDMELVDLDNDNDLDLIVTGGLTSDYSATQSYKNNGYGNFSLLQSSELPQIGASTVATGDIDGDNDVDMYISGYWDWSGYYSELFLNNGSGIFSPTSSPFPAVIRGESKFFDADNDDDLDLFVFGKISFGQEITQLYFNNGAGQFTPSSQVFTPNSEGSLEIADVNQDGFSDILICGEGNGIPSNTKLLINNGAGVFNQSPQIFQGISWGTAHFIDLEEDGDPDIIINGLRNGYGSLHSNFYINDGLGEYTDVGNRSLDSLKSCNLIHADIDEDGDQDIFLSGRNSDNIDTCAIYLNNNGYFTKDSSFVAIGLFEGDAVFGDLNNDCSPDIIYCGFGNQCQNESFTYFNQFYFTDECKIQYPSETIPIEFVVEYTVQSNPFSDIIRISVNTAVDKIWIYDYSGRLIKEFYQDSPEITIDLSDLSNSMYFLRFNTKNFNTKFTEKLLKVE